MSAMEIVGLLLWILVILFGQIKINNRRVHDTTARILLATIAFPIVGLVFILIGLLGKVMLSPLLHFFSWN
jgi:hypothetical protein